MVGRGATRQLRGPSRPHTRRRDPTLRHTPTLHSPIASGVAFRAIGIAQGAPSAERGAPARPLLGGVGARPRAGQPAPEGAVPGSPARGAAPAPGAARISPPFLFSPRRPRPRLTPLSLCPQSLRTRRSTTQCLKKRTPKNPKCAAAPRLERCTARPPSPATPPRPSARPRKPPLLTILRLPPQKKKHNHERIRHRFPLRR